MADMGTKLKNYGIGALAGLAIYHFILEKQYPTIFKPLGNDNRDNISMQNTGCTSCGQKMTR